MVVEHPDPNPSSLNGGLGLSMHDQSDRALLEQAYTAAENILTHVDAEDQSTNWAFDMVVEPNNHRPSMFVDRISVLLKADSARGPNWVKRRISVLRQLLAQNPRGDEVNNLIIRELCIGLGESERVEFAISIARY